MLLGMSDFGQRVVLGHDRLPEVELARELGGESRAQVRVEDGLAVLECVGLVNRTGRIALPRKAAVHNDELAI
jgi:hypothetical protein